MLPHHHAVVLPSISSALQYTTMPTPSPQSGQILVTVLRTPIPSYTRATIAGQRTIPLATPMVFGISAIARIAATGSDTTNRHVGQLVYVDSVVRARDDQIGEDGTQSMQGYRASNHVLSYVDWRHGPWAEKMLVPLENTYVLDEDLLLNQLGYTLSQLAWLNILLVPYGGYLAANLQAGETVIMCFATGNFGAAAIDVALAMGARRVIAVGRRLDALEKTQARYEPGKVSIVALSGNVEDDVAALRDATPKSSGAEILLDLAPAGAGNGYLKSALGALKRSGRALLMAGLAGDVPIPYADVVRRELTMIGKLMYGREVPVKMIKLLESGNLKLNRIETLVFELDSVEEAVDKAVSISGDGRLVVVAPENADI